MPTNTTTPLDAVKTGLRFLKRVGGGSTKLADDTSLIPPEYKYLGMFLGQFLWTLRLSMGDFGSIDSTLKLSDEENWIFWAVWILTVIITNVVFLNFIVAEASASYEKVTETLEAVIQKERANMIMESETMSLKRKKTAYQYPPYIIVRTIET